MRWPATLGSIGCCRRNLDGVADRICERSFDAEGQLLTDVRDEDLDGNPETSLSQTYNAQGLLIRHERIVAGSTHLIQHWDYDAEGNLLSYSRDTNADGSPDNIQSYTYNSDGDRLTQSSDTDADGVAESITTFAYDENRNQVAFEIDSNADGVADVRRTSDLDSSNRLVMTHYDREADGVVDVVSEFSEFVDIGLTQVLYQGRLRQSSWRGA